MELLGGTCRGDCGAVGRNAVGVNAVGEAVGCEDAVGVTVELLGGYAVGETVGCEDAVGVAVV